MRSGMVMELIAEYSKIFDDSPNIDDLLKGISKATLLKISSFFLGFENRNSKFQDSKDFIQMYFSPENLSFATSVYKKVRELENNSEKETGKYTAIRFTSHITSLSLFEYAYNNLDDIQSLSEADIEINVFKAYLLLNEVNLKKTITAWESVDELEVDNPISARLLTTSYGYSDLINYDKHMLIITQIIKSIYFFRIFRVRK
jgi:hypothetical protein